MRRVNSIFFIAALLTGIALLVWVFDEVWRSTPPQSGSRQSAAPTPDDVLHLGLIPERDIFAQAARYRRLADYLGEQIDRPIELAMCSTYAGVLQDFEESQIDMAFLGSFVAFMAMERQGTEVLVKPVGIDGGQTYRGVIFVNEDSDIHEIADVAGRTIAMVKATTAGELFPISEFVTHGLWKSLPGRPRIQWLATHDDVVKHVSAGLVEAGAAKDTRIEAFLQANPEVRFRRLAVSDAVPSNALVVRSNLPDALVASIESTLLTMHQSDEGRAVLDAFGAQSFVPCQQDEYGPIPRMIQSLGSAWYDLGLGGPPPTPPTHNDHAQAEKGDGR